MKLSLWHSPRKPTPGTIELRDVSKLYGKRYALRNVNTRLERGDFAFLVGPSGAGKTSILRLLMRDEKATRGRVLLGNVDMAILPGRQVAAMRRRIGMVFQDYRLLPSRTVGENVAFALQVTGMADEEIRPRVEHALVAVDLADRYDALPHELSGGEQQRTAIARALVRSPEFLFADEPTGNLDPQTSWEIMNLLCEINARGVTMLVATHNADLVTGLQRRVIELAGGELVRDSVGGYHDRPDADADANMGDLVPSPAGVA